MLKLPRHVTAVISALKFRAAQPEALRDLDESEWTHLLTFTDRMHLTLFLGAACPDYLPDWVRSRIERNLADNSARFERIKSAYVEIAESFRGLGIEHLVVKGFAQSVAFSRDPRLRFQSDIDLFCPPASRARAQDALAQLRYEPVKWVEYFPSDQHLTSVMRKTNWQWNGNAFDPEMPFSVEVHERFWNESTARFGPTGLEYFWDRHTQATLGFTFPALDPIDSLGYSCLHSLRHVLYGSLLTNHIYELACFLHSSSKDESFWKRWRESHDPSLRSLEAICFRLARNWFACDVSSDAEEEIERLSPPVKQWFEMHGQSPLYTAFRTNKDALWLHLSLIKSSRERFSFFLHSVVLRRIPSLKGLFDGQAGMMAWRASYHARTFLPTLWNGVRWWWSTKKLGNQFRA